MRLIPLVGALSLLAACTLTKEEKYPSSDVFCAAKAQEDCQVAPRCGVAVDACRQARAGLCNTHAADTASAGRRYDAGNVQPCLDAVHGLYASNDPLTPAALQGVTDTCERVFDGTLDLGAPCATSYACASGRLCDKGYCANQNVKGSGDFCSNPGDVCGGDAYCGSGSPPQCLPDAAQGAACDATVRCARGLRCLSVCVPTLPSGAACVTDSDCDPGGGAPYCDPNAGRATPVCTAGIIFAPSAVALCSQYGGR